MFTFEMQATEYSLGCSGCFRDVILDWEFLSENDAVIAHINGQTSLSDEPLCEFPEQEQNSVSILINYSI